MNYKSGKTFFAALILVFVLSVLPMGTALAGNGPVDVSVTVMNNTVGSVSLHLTGEGGSFWLEVSAAGMGKVMVPEGKYEYYLFTPCGGKSGEMNLNVSKVMSAVCDGNPDLSTTNRARSDAPVCGLYAWFHGPGQFWGHWHPEEDTSRMPTWDLPQYWELRCTDGDPTFRMWWF